MTIEELDVFKLAHEMALAIYRISERFPADERFGLMSQMRRAASSVPSNLMEGLHRVGSKELKRFVSIARGSCGELKYQIVLSRDLGYIEQAEFDKLRDGLERVSMMLTKLYASLDEKNG